MEWAVLIQTGGQTGVIKIDERKGGRAGRAQKKETENLGGVMNRLENAKMR